MRKRTTGCMSAMIAVATALSLPVHAQTTGDRGDSHPPTTDESGQRNMTGQVSEMMENCSLVAQASLAL